jgi:restriction endonuclease S subunit
MNLPGNESLMRNANNYVSEKVRLELGAKAFKPGTVIFPKVGGALHTNKKRVLIADSLVDNNLMGVTVMDERKCLPEFLFRWFETVNLSGLSNPGPLPSINATRVKATPIALPPLSEQREIARQLAAVDAKLAALEARRAALDALFTSLLHHLMTGRLRLPEFRNAKGPSRPAAGDAGT